MSHGNWQGYEGHQLKVMEYEDISIRNKSAHTDMHTCMSVLK